MGAARLSGSLVYPHSDGPKIEGYMNQILIGIDPGVTGAVAFYRPSDGALVIEDMPTRTRPNGRREVCGKQLAGMIAKFCNFHNTAIVEWVSAMTGKESAASMFQFGRSYGMILGVLAAHHVATIETPPGVWKGLLGLSRDKRKSLEMARDVFPKHRHYFVLQKHNGRAEAALLAYLGVRALSSIVSGTNMTQGQLENPFD